MEDPVVPLERNLYGHPLAGLMWERQFEKILLKHGWEKIPNWVLICVFGRRKIGWKETQYGSDVEITSQRSSFGRTNIFSLIMKTWDALKENVK